jgi:tetratricopeptide (TPR) repeat protein
MIMRAIRKSMIAAAILLICGSTSAYACCSEVEARAALHSGDFIRAATAVQTNTSIQARLIAAEALSAQVLLGLAEDGKETAKEALSICESVLAEEPNNTEARFQYALADGFVTRATSPFSAWRKKLPQRTFDVVTELVATVPEDGRAHALLGAWHVGILRKTGEKNGRKWFGADIAAGRTAYERALELRPNDIIITSNYALSLAELDFATHSETAYAMLQTAVSAAPQDAVETQVQTRMQEVLSLWDDAEAREKRIAHFLDGDG